MISTEQSIDIGALTEGADGVGSMPEKDALATLSVESRAVA